MLWRLREMKLRCYATHLENKMKYGELKRKNEEEILKLQEYDCGEGGMLPLLYFLMRRGLLRMLSQHVRVV